MQLSNVLLHEAIDLGLCEQWQREWGTNPTEQELIDKFRRGIDFCLSHHWPSCKFINEHFGQALLRKNNILVNDHYSLLNPAFAALLGQTSSTIRYSGNKPSHIYIGGHSVAKIFIKTSALIIVEVRDSAQVEIIPDEHYKISTKIFCYSDDAVVIAPKEIVCVKSNDYLD